MESGRPETIPGYNPPTNFSYSRKNIYKTFTEGRKTQEFGNTMSFNKYAVNETNDDTVCPLCSEPPKTICDCVYNDKYCVNNHVWYTDRKGNVVKNKSPHS